jgi:hypothetical protein
MTLSTDHHDIVVCGSTRAEEGPNVESVHEGLHGMKTTKGVG